MKDYRAQLDELKPITKTGDFVADTQAGYYRYERDRCWLQGRLGIEPDYLTWSIDFNAFLLAKGVPDRYVAKVAWAAYERGHNAGEEEILKVSYSLIEIFN